MGFSFFFAVCCCSFVCSFIHLVGCVRVCLWVFWNMIFFKTGVRPSVLLFLCGQKMCIGFDSLCTYSICEIQHFFIHFPLFCYHNFNIYILSPWGYTHMHVHMFATLQIITLRRSCLRPNICLGANLFYTIVLNCLETPFLLPLESLLRYAI